MDCLGLGIHVDSPAPFEERFGDVQETGLIVAILGQQISVISAASIQRRLVDTFGERISVEGRKFFSFPRPSVLAKATVKQLKECALSTMKAQYVHDISRSVINGDLDIESLANIEDSEEVIGRLMDIRGIGRWTAEMAAIRGLSRYDVVPAGDIGLRRDIAQFYGLETASEDDVREIARSWGEWKGMATYYLYVASRLGLSVGGQSRIRSPSPQPSPDKRPPHDP